MDLDRQDQSKPGITPFNPVTEGWLSNAPETVLVGPPGTGKTAAVLNSWLIPALRDTESRQILACSFTKAAAVEMRTRLAKEVSLDELDLRRACSTIHSEAYRLVKLNGGPSAIWKASMRKPGAKPGQEPGDTAADDDDIEDPWESMRKPKDELREEAERVWSITRHKWPGNIRLSLDPANPGLVRAISRTLTFTESHFRPDVIAAEIRAYEADKHSAGSIDFTDMLVNAIPYQPDWRELVLCDECFPAGTLVETKKGAVPIEHIVNTPNFNGEVLSCIDGGKTLCYSTVEAAYCTELKGIIVKIDFEGGALVTTANHPIWIEGHSWIPAGMVAEGDSVCHLRRSDRQESHDLFQIMRAENECNETRPVSGGRTEEKNINQNDGGKERNPKSNGRRGSKTENVGNAEKNRPRAACSRGERNRAIRIREAALRSVDPSLADAAMAPRVCCRAWDSKDKGGASDPLQDRSGIAGEKDSRRSGRLVSQFAFKKSVGCAEKCNLEISRVVRVSRIQQRSQSRCHESCSGNFVYTLKVTAGNYFANGILVKNCQDLSPLQILLVERWAEQSRALVFVGDPDQGIYRFSGADGEHLTSLMRRDDLVVRSLQKSWRVPGIAHAMARCVILRNRLRVDAPYSPTDDPGELHRLRDAEHAAQFSADRADLDHGVFILSRTCKGLAPYAQALEQAGIPFSNERGSSPLKNRQSVLTVLCLLDILERRMVGKEALTALVKSIPGRPRSSWFTGTKKAAQEAVAALQDGQHIRAMELGPVGLDYSEIASCGSLESALESIRKLESSTPILRILAHGGARALRNEPSITLTTMHASKGREAYTVVVDLHAPYPVRKTLTGGALEEVEAERRVVYVALTRTLHTLALVDGELSYLLGAAL